MSARRASRGFSLLEATAAIALLALAIPAILAAFSDTTLRVAVAQDRLDTLRRAQDLLVLAKVQFHGVTGSHSGSDAEAVWTVDTSRLPLDERSGAREAGGPVPIHLAVAVLSKRGAEVRLNTLFLFEEPMQ